ncbi:MAG TPA: sigma 54-interacting transcriptional regulator [Bryobacteraceae bacterium]
MEAEFIVISGPLLGTRIPLGPEEIRIGRSPTAQIRLAEPEAAWDHCVVRLRDGRYRIADCHTGAGTYVNGMRTTDHALEPDDQVSIGDTVMVYREDSAVASPDSLNHALLRACSLLFLFRAIALSQSGSHRATLEGQVLRLIADIVPCDGGAVLLGRDEEELRAAAREHSSAPYLEELGARVFREGAVVEASLRVVALALYVRGAVAGVLAASFPAAEIVLLSDHRDTLSAIVTLAAAALETVREVERLQSQNALLLERLGTTETGMVGQSAAIAKLSQMIARVAPQDTSVLILGESGVGKELVARALHAQSRRASLPFIAINCAALTETLLESEMFGHEKGAFTGAVAQKKGKLEVAEGGTVFLDEIGELAPQLQAKLLRVLQQREFERVGGTRTIKLDVRLIAATNRDLATEARRGAFREDLYHRLNVVALRVPPLRDRPEDIPALAHYFLDRASARCRRRVGGISPEAVRYLTGYSWPGNVRELENAIERAVVLGQSDQLLAEDLPETILESSQLPEIPGALHSSMTQTKRQLILNAWQETGGDHKRVAERLNIHPNSLRRLIRNLRLRDVLE